MIVHTMGLSWLFGFAGSMAGRMAGRGRARQSWSVVDNENSKHGHGHLQSEEYMLQLDH